VAAVLYACLILALRSHALNCFHKICLQRERRCRYAVLARIITKRTANDILLLAPRVTLLDRLFTVCEVGLTFHDVAVNSKKSCWLRVGARCDRPCNNLCTPAGHLIPWVDEMRYLGLFIIRSHTFKCSLDHAKRSFYRAVNRIFGRIGRTASEEVILELIKSKCLPIPLYGLEACPLNKTNLTLDFSVNRFFTGSIARSANLPVFSLLRGQF